MDTSSKELSVAEASKLCGVGHGTVGYWIRSKGLFAHRIGKNYTIPVEELVCFLKATGQPVPNDLKGRYFARPCFRTIQPCWQYMQNRADAHDCDACTVFRKQVEICFTAKECNKLACSNGCRECMYYMEIFFPRLQLLYQIKSPAAVYQGLHVWEANDKFTELCGLSQNDLPGIGIENVFHHESLETVLSNIRRRALEDPDVPTTYSVYLKRGTHGKAKADVAIYRLEEPAKTNLIIVEPHRAQ